MIRNIPSIADLQSDPSLAADLPIDVIATLLQDCDDTRRVADASKKTLIGHLINTYLDKIDAAFEKAQKDHGTIHLMADGFDVEVTREKKVEWSQLGLAQLHGKIEASGEQAADYIKVTYAVEERKYASWPAALRTQFDEHRTTKSGSVTVKVTPRSAGD